jgi:hypothetical protein
MASCLTLSPELIEEEKPNEHRTYYDSLDLHTPETAVETFVEAFWRLDFVTVHMILAPAAQQRLLDRRALLIWDGVIQTEGGDNHPEEVIKAFTGRIRPPQDHLLDGTFEFDRLMFTAAEHNALQVNLAGHVAIVSRKQSETILGQEAIDVGVEIDGIAGLVTFRMVQSPDGRWRVFQITFPGGDESEFPWSMAATTIDTPVDDWRHFDNHGFRTYYDSLDLTTPQAAVTTFVEKFEQKNFPAVFLILHSEAQSAWMRDFTGRRYHNLVATAMPARILAETEFAHRLRALEESGIISEAEARDTFVRLSLAVPYQGSIWIQEIPYISLVMEHIGDVAYLYDQIMMAADGQHPIDLRGPLMITQAHAPESVNNGEVITITALLPDTNAEVIFRLKQSSDGRWRILQVVVPGGDVEDYPWAVPRDVQ